MISIRMQGSGKVGFMTLILPSDVLGLGPLVLGFGPRAFNWVLVLGTKRGFGTRDFKAHARAVSL